MTCPHCLTECWEISTKPWWCPTCEKWWWEVIMMNEFPGPATIPHAPIEIDHSSDLTTGDYERDSGSHGK